MLPENTGTLQKAVVILEMSLLLPTLLEVVNAIDTPVIPLKYPETFLELLGNTQNALETPGTPYETRLTPYERH